MADDGDDQIKNALNAIKAQLTATATPAELARLGSEAAGLLPATNNPKLIDQIKAVQSAISKKEENAEQNIISKNAANLTAETPQPDPEALREQQEHEEREQRLARNLAAYESIEKDFRQQLKDDRTLIRQAIDDPSSLTPKQKRELTGEYLDEDEKREAERKAQQEINGTKLLYEVEKDLKKSKEHNNKQIKEIREKIKTEPDPQKKQALQNEEQKHQQANNKIDTELDNKINPAIAELEAKKQDLKELVEKHPEFSKEKVRIHFEGNIDKYKELAAQDPNYKGLEEMYDIVKKAGLEKELGIEKEIEAHQKASNTKTETLQKTSNPSPTQKPKPNIQVDPAIAAQEKYGKNNVPPEVIKDATVKKVVNLGHEGDAQIIAGKQPTKEISKEKITKIEPPYPTPAMAKFAKRGKEIG